MINVYYLCIIYLLLVNKSHEHHTTLLWKSIAKDVMVFLIKQFLKKKMP